MAGVPLCTHQGPSGGVEIMDGYAVDRSVFTMDEIETICIALRGTDSALGESYTDCETRQIRAMRAELESHARGI